ncbi:hypothetical protein C1645_819058 [Glomus cerebriforme]|uniref:Uncharacterized protein n=1 Tax=Glomus cerebriforme TaxID=658196 RepID=A0A397T735_9GLOM|nr:hypothetical protein C1645_819058 [Glomus cerebriforme]
MKLKDFLFEDLGLQVWGFEIGSNSTWILKIRTSALGFDLDFECLYWIRPGLQKTLVSNYTSWTLKLKVLSGGTLKDFEGPMIWVYGISKISSDVNFWALLLWILKFLVFFMAFSKIPCVILQIEGSSGGL